MDVKFRVRIRPNFTRGSCLLAWRVFIRSHFFNNHIHFLYLSEYFSIEVILVDNQILINICCKKAIAQISQSARMQGFRLQFTGSLQLVMQ